MLADPVNRYDPVTMIKRTAQLDASEPTDATPAVDLRQRFFLFTADSERVLT